MVKDCVYLTTTEAAEYWGIKQKKVSEYCRQKRVPGAKKDKEGRWQIPSGSMLPMTDIEIRNMLTLTLMLKNERGHAVQHYLSQFPLEMLPAVYKYLSDIQMVYFSGAVVGDTVAREAIITRQGLELLFPNTGAAEVQFDHAKWKSRVELALAWAPVLVQIARP